MNYSRYWYADFFIRFRVSRLFQRSIWRQSERICDVKLTFDDVILTISRNYPWPVMTSSLYRSLMSWNHISINYLGTVADIDLPFFYDTLLVNAVQMSLNMNCWVQAPRRRRLHKQTDRQTLLIYIYRNHWIVVLWLFTLQKLKILRIFDHIWRQIYVNWRQWLCYLNKYSSDTLTDCKYWYKLS